MHSALIQPASAPIGRELLERVEALGLTLLRARRDGTARMLCGGNEAARAWMTSGMLPQALQRAWPDLCETTRTPRAIELLPGLWAYGLAEASGVAVEERRTLDRIHVVLMPTPESLASEHFQAACDRSGVDREVVARVCGSHTFSKEEAQRLALTLCWLGDDSRSLQRRNGELQGLSMELADTYEELSLLYRLATSLRVNQSAEEVLRDACDELHQVVGFAWVAFCLSEDERLQDVSGATVLISADDMDQHLVRCVADGLIESLRAQPAPVIFDDCRDSGIAEIDRLGRNLLAIPLMVEGRVLGVMFGGDRIDGEMLSSIDAKLCESLAGSLAIYLENHMLYGDAQGMFLGALHALTAAIDAKDSYTHGHSERVALLARTLAESIGLDQATCESVYLSGLVHDVGKIGVPESVLCKPGRLTDEEFDLIKLHPRIGANILKDIRQMQELVPGVLYHHERYDGRGYPDGLAGEDIPLFGRLIGLADAFDAMSSHRTYRKALNLQDVLNEIRRCAGAQFDPQLAEVFVKMDFEPFRQLIVKHQALNKPA